MQINLRVYDDAGHLVSDFDYDNPLELIEKSIELFKEEGGQVGYKVPEGGEKYLCHETNTKNTLMLHGPLNTDVSPYLGVRLTFTPPKPEPKESEWEKLQEKIQYILERTGADTYGNTTKTLMDKIDKLEKRLGKE